jgi:peptide/nickel transport system substrate-binding protein
MIKDDGGSVIPAHGNLLDARSSKVKGLVPHPMGSLGYYQFGETCWLDS